MDRDTLKSMNWDTLSTEEQAAWLYAIVLNHKFAENNGRLFVENEPPLVIDANLITQCERALNREEVNLYMSSVLSEASVQTYSGMSDEQIQKPETALRFYTVLFYTPMDVRGRCIYWAKRGQRA